MYQPFQSASIFIDANFFLLPGASDSESWRRDLLDFRISRLESKLFIVKSNFNAFHARLRSLAWAARVDQVWEDYYRELLGHAFGLEIEHQRLQELQTIASTDIWRACELLAVEIHRSFTGKLVKLRRDLHATRSLRALLLRFASTAYRFHNKIVLQRRFYLTHGSHPTENPVSASEGRLDSQIGGCVPAFQI